LISRLDNKATGAIIVVTQRVHLHDLTGFLTERSGEWIVLNLPAIAEVDEKISIGNGLVHVRRAGEVLHPDYESREVLESLRQQMGPDLFAAQYQQSPVPPGGAIIKREWLRYYDELPERKPGARVIQSWDTAAKDGARNDWSVCTTWLMQDKKFYLLDLVRGRYNYPQLRDTARKLAERFRPHVILIEDASTGTALAQELRQAGVFVVQPISVERDKQTRLFVQQAKFAAGDVLFPKGVPFVADLERELLSFPQGKTDDQVDSLSQALAYKSKYGYDSTMLWVTGK
jgi:predicted phage terminase large subunit-like protein